MKRRLLLVLLFLAGMNIVSAQTDKDFSAKEAFRPEYPKQFTFRGEYNTRANADYESYAASAAFSCGFIQKYVPYDEMMRLDPVRTAHYAVRYAREHPEKTVLLHWDAEEHVNSIPESASKYFPGHWALYEGSVLSSPLDRTSEWIHVADAAPLNMPLSNPKARSKWKCPVLLVVALDATGKPVWADSEYVAIDEIDMSRNAVRVRRGVALSTPRKFAAGSRVMPISSYLGSEYLFCFNYSVDCPRDENGKTAADVEFEELCDLFEPGSGLLYGLDGIAFDVLNWMPPHDRELLDTNGDGKADGAFDLRTGEDLWRRGAYAFQKRLREHFGPDFILANDGYSEKDQRAVGVFNGIESEGLVRHNDAFRGFSKTVNVFGYWAACNPMTPRMATIVPKVMNGADKPREEQYVRLCMATATCLGAAVNNGPVVSEEEVPDEMRGGNLNRACWLGAPLGAMRNYGLEGWDLLDGTGQTDSFADQWQADNCEIRRQGAGMAVVGRNSGAYDPHSVLRMAPIRIPEGVNDITVTFEIRAVEGLKDMDASVPRMVRLSAEGLPSYEKSRNLNRMYNDMWGLCDTQGYMRQTFCFRNVAGREIGFVLDIEGRGEVLIRDFRVNAATEALARVYENGAVLVNPSLQAHTFDLEDLSPGVRYARLKGTSSVNNGRREDRFVTLGPLEGLFLRRVDSF